MKMRRGFGFVWALLTLAIAGVAAWFAYHAGLATTIAASGHDGVYYGGGPGYYGFGFGFFPLFLFIILLLLLFRRRRWHGYWGGGWGGHGPGYGPPRDGHELPPAIDERLRSWHERAHGPNPTEPPASQGGSGQAGSGQPGGPPGQVT